MGRRLFLKLTGIIGLLALAYNFSSLLEFTRRVQGKFVKAQILPPDVEREMVELNPKGETITLEMALNSRCTSDYNGRQEIFHWGLFDPTKRLSADAIRRLVSRVPPPRFTDGFLEIKVEDNMLHFIMADESDALKRAWMMVESGMQQQMVCLLCAAFGVGMVFKSLGDNGTVLPDGNLGNTRIKLDAMKPSYDGAYWIETKPKGWRPWLDGNLPPPDRKGTATLTGLISSEVGKRQVKSKTIQFAEIGQLLWAARGRTPHYYKCKPWGMTIPVSRGQQDLTNVLVMYANHLFRYSNWEGGRPTHKLTKINQIESESIDPLTKLFPESSSNCRIILSRNENSGRALWEIGYQLVNILLQAKAISAEVHPILVDEGLRNRLHGIGVPDACAVVSMTTEELPSLSEAP